MQLTLSGINVSVVDERNEISAMYKGISENDLGIRTDILTNIPKNIGIEMLVRSMSPNVIVADEIGNEADFEAIKYAMCSGVKGIFTAHGSSLDNLRTNPIFKKILDIKLFDKIIFLDEKEKGKILKVYDE